MLEFRRDGSAAAAASRRGMPSKDGNVQTMSRARFAGRYRCCGARARRRTEDSRCTGARRGRRVPAQTGIEMAAEAPVGVVRHRDLRPRMRIHAARRRLALPPVRTAFDGDSDRVAAMGGHDFFRAVLCGVRNPRFRMSVGPSDTADRGHRLVRFELFSMGRARRPGRAVAVSRSTARCVSAAVPDPGWRPGSAAGCCPAPSDSAAPPLRSACWRGPCRLVRRARSGRPRRRS